MGSLQQVNVTIGTLERKLQNSLIWRLLLQTYYWDRRHWQIQDDGFMNW